MTETGPVMSPTATLVLLEAPTDDMVWLGIHGMNYRLGFVPSVVAAEFPKPASTRNPRVHGEIHGRALKMHRANAGGRFIEPSSGQPRIVQGTVFEVDAANNRLLMDVVVPMWITVDSVASGQRASEFAQGDLLNFYLESGTSFTPA